MDTFHSLGQDKTSTNRNTFTMGKAKEVSNQEGEETRVNSGLEEIDTKTFGDATTKI